jgi:ABC-type oligopeptide transport system substrate-binding subunit
MPRRVWLSLVMLVTGVALMSAAQFAGASPDRKGGIFKVGTTGSSVQIDPQLSYITTGWWLEYATAAKLYDYRPGGKLVPEVASGFKVSNGGRRYTFAIRRGFRFSDGARVTARNFEYAFDRATSPELQSPAAQFAANVRGVHAHGMKLVVDLSSTNGDLIATLAMPFFQATSTKLPLDREVSDVRSMADLPTAGPYAFTFNDVNRLTSLRRNPYWKRGPGRTAPRNLDGVDVQWNLDEQTAFDMVKANELDEGPIPASEEQNLASQYGVNRSRFWVKPTSDCIGLIAFNNNRSLFRGNPELRKAFNWALDRTVYNGPGYNRSPWTHLLPPGYPGSITNPSRQPYAPTADVQRAYDMAVGHLRDGKITVFFRTSTPLSLAEAEQVRRALLYLGFAYDDITMKGFAGADIYDAMGKRGSEFDMAISLGWCASAIEGSSFLPFGGVPPFFPDLPRYRSKIAGALRLKSNARFAALGKLDLDIMRNVAPVAVTNTFNNLYFFSNRVDPRSLEFHTVYEDWSIPALALK